MIPVRKVLRLCKASFKMLTIRINTIKKNRKHRWSSMSLDTGNLKIVACFNCSRHQTTDDRRFWFSRKSSRFKIKFEDFVLILSVPRILLFGWFLFLIFFWLGYGFFLFVCLYDCLFVCFLNFLSELDLFANKNVMGFFAFLFYFLIF